MANTVAVKYDPREFVRGLQQILTSHTKKIAFLAGAGTSMAVQPAGGSGSLIPGVIQMTHDIEASLRGPFGRAFQAIKAELRAEGENEQIENILSRIRLKAQVAGDDILCGLDKQQLHELEKLVCAHIKRIVSPDPHTIPDGDSFPHQMLARWISRATRHQAVEIFTTNYDYLFEIALEREKIAYFDGFAGTVQPFFHSALVEENDLPAGWVRLWKVHGSLGWRLDADTRRIVRDRGDENEIMVYPSLLKYDDSKKQPYVSYIDRLSGFLRGDDSVLLVCGYSFGDQHLNDTMLNALSRSRTSQVFVLHYGDIEKTDAVVKLAERETSLTVFAQNAAVIGGQYGIWELGREPSKADAPQVEAYFDEDAAPPLGAITRDNAWTGSGKMTLGDFRKFVAFLASMSAGGSGRGE